MFNQIDVEITCTLKSRKKSAFRIDSGITDFFVMFSMVEKKNCLALYFDFKGKIFCFSHRKSPIYKFNFFFLCGILYFSRVTASSQYCILIKEIITTPSFDLKIDMTGRL